VLGRIGIAARVDEDPRLAEVRFVDRALIHIGERLGAAADDPTMEALAGGMDEAPEDEPLAAALRALVVDVRRSCRRRARMGLWDVVSRRGFIEATRTHVDVLFDARDADIRVRRAALDVDPGWVPWFGRVVRFHYVDGMEGYRGETRSHERRLP
jgi:hypothetical protein